MVASRRRASGVLAKTEAALRAHALGKPAATEHFPWGERAIKVAGKVFLFMHAGPTQLSLSTKLPASSGVALMLPFANPTGYGLGKAGWISATFTREDTPPLEMLCAWIDESYQAIAPAKLAAIARGAAQLVTRPTKRPAAPSPTKRPTAARPTKRPTAARPTKRPTAARPTKRPTAARPTKRPAAPSPTKRPR
jgi:predicted DNA-binding protein (MmcQ/YjbR family)